MKIFKAILLTIIVALTVTTTTAQTPQVTLKSLLEEMTDLSSLATYPQIQWLSLQASSYNRASVGRDQPGWFADSDGLGFIRTETINDKTEWVIMEHDGPGCITKMWTPFFYYGFADRVGPDVRIYLDGSKQPIVDDSLIELLTEKLFVKHPFSVLTARAGDLYLPIPFAKNCKITTTKKPFYNIINYRGYPSNVEVETFNMHLFKEATTQLEKAGTMLTSPLAATGVQHLYAKENIAPGKELSINMPRGNGAVGQIEIQPLFRPL